MALFSRISRNHMFAQPVLSAPLTGYGLRLAAPIGAREIQATSKAKRCIRGRSDSVCVCAVFKLNLSLARASWLSSKAVS